MQKLKKVEDTPFRVHKGAMIIDRRELFSMKLTDGRTVGTKAVNYKEAVARIESVLMAKVA